MGRGPPVPGAGVNDDTAPTPTCPICGHDRDDWTTCPGCVRAVDTMLGELLDLHALAGDPAHLLPAQRGADTGHSSERPLGVNVAALDLAHGESLLGVLASWERWWREHLGHSTPTTPEDGPRHPRWPRWAPTDAPHVLSRTVAYLRAQWPTMAALVEPPPDEFAHEVRALHRNALNALSLTRFDLDPDPAAKEPPDYTVPCPGCGLTIGMHRQPRTVDGHHDTVRMNCERCGWHGTGEWLIRVAVASGARPAMSLAQVMDHYQVTERTVRRWVVGGRLEHRRGMYVARHADES